MTQDILIVTATLGNRESLDRTISSVREIGGGRVKHILVTPRNNVDKLKEKYSFLEILAEPNNCKGIYQALNFALRLNANDYHYWGFLNDDDYWLPDYVRLINIMDNSSDVDVVYGKVKYVNDKNREIGSQASSPRYKVFGQLLKQNIILFTQQSVLARVDLLSTLGGFDESFKLVADTKFWLDAIVNKYKFQYVDTFCAAYMIQADQLSSNKEVQASEQKRLIQNIPDEFRLKFVFEVLFYRIYNIPTYAKRLINKGKLNSAASI